MKTNDTEPLTDLARRADAGDQDALRTLAAKLANTAVPPFRQLTPEAEARLGRLAELEGLSPERALASSVWRVADLAEMGHARGGGFGGYHPSQHVLSMLNDLFLPGLDHALRAVELTEGEASLVVDVLKTSMYPQPPLAENDPALLSDEIAEALEEDEENLAATWGVDYLAFGEKMWRLSWIQAIAVRDAVHRFWRDVGREQGVPLRERLQRVGLFRPKPTREQLATTVLSAQGFKRREDKDGATVQEPLGGPAWKAIAVEVAGCVLVARLMGWEVAPVMLGEELRGWTRNGNTTRFLISLRPRGPWLSLSGLRDTFDAEWIQEAHGYILLAQPAARLVSSEQSLDVQQDPDWVRAEQVFAQALRVEGDEAPEGKRPLTAVSNGDPSRLRQVAWDTVRIFLLSNWHVVERVATALVADTRLTILTTEEVDRLISGGNQ